MQTLGMEVEWETVLEPALYSFKTSLGTYGSPLNDAICASSGSSGLGLCNPLCLSSWLFQGTLFRGGTQARGGCLPPPDPHTATPVNRLLLPA